jgi:hypothetical protein
VAVQCRAHRLMKHIPGFTSVDVFFFGTRKCVPGHTFLLFWLTSSYVEDRNKMSASCMFYVVQRCSWVPMVVQALWSTRAILPTSQHITSMNIRSIFDELACRRAPQRHKMSCKKKKAYYVNFYTYVESCCASLLPLPLSPPHCIDFPPPLILIVPTLVADQSMNRS